MNSKKKVTLCKLNLEFWGGKKTFGMCKLKNDEKKSKIYTLKI